MENHPVLGQVITVWKESGGTLYGLCTYVDEVGISLDDMNYIPWNAINIVNIMSRGSKK